MPHAFHRSHRIHYRSLGDPAAPPVLFVMGLGLSSTAWDALPARLADRFRILLFDNRGTGGSGRGDRLHRMAELADDAAAVLDAAGCARAGVFGISMGGVIAQELALRHPSRVASLALGATFVDARGLAWPSPSALLDLLLLNCGERFATPERVARLLVSRDFERARPGRAAAWLRSDSGQPSTLLPVLAQLAAIAAHRSAARLSTLRVPTLVLSGDEDRVIPVENAVELSRRIPGARLHLLRGAGHAFPLEREDETAAALAEHFSATLAGQPGVRAAS